MLDLEDFFVSQILLPIGALMIVLFCVVGRYGWGFDNFVKEANTGRGLKIAKWMKPYFVYILPVVVLAVFVLSILSFFGVI